MFSRTAYQQERRREASNVRHRAMISRTTKELLVHMGEGKSKTRARNEKPGPLHYDENRPLPSYDGSGASCTTPKQGLAKKHIQ